MNHSRTPPLILVKWDGECSRCGALIRKDTSASPSPELSRVLLKVGKYVNCV